MKGDTRPSTIIVHGLGKRFFRYDSDRPRTLKEVFVRGLRHRRPVSDFWALRDVNFEISQGTMVGVIGRNGAGKSTLLRLIGGVGRPDEGDVQVTGRINAFLDLTAGFRPDLTGRENLIIGGVIAGLTRREIDQRLDDIIEFSEVQEFIDDPLRTYSTGMRMRLAFAVAAHTEPDVLLIDEVLSVGDLAFQRKCFERIEQFKRQGCTILLVSHSLQQVERLCDEALWLRKGRLVSYGDAKTVVKEYVADIAEETKRRTPTEQPAAPTHSNSDPGIEQHRLGSLELKIVDVRVRDRHGLPCTELESGEPLHIEIDYLAQTPVPAPIFGVGIIGKHERHPCCTTSTDVAGLRMPILHGRGTITVHFERLDLVGGEYYINVGAYEQEWRYAYDYHWKAYPLLIQTTSSRSGVLNPPVQWQFKKATDIGRTRLLDRSRRTRILLEPNKRP